MHDSSLGLLVLFIFYFKSFNCIQDTIVIEILFA